MNTRPDPRCGGGTDRRVSSHTPHPCDVPSPNATSLRKSLRKTIRPGRFGGGLSLPGPPPKRPGPSPGAQRTEPSADPRPNLLGQQRPSAALFDVFFAFFFDFGFFGDRFAFFFLRFDLRFFLFDFDFFLVVVFLLFGRAELR